MSLEAPKTTFVNDINPFAMQYKTSLPTPKKAKAKEQTAAPTDQSPLPPDLAKYEIRHHDPLPERKMAFYKYAPLFDRMKFGDSLVCQPDEVSRISSALAKYLERNRIEGHMRHCTNYQNSDTGRVWMLPGPSRYPKRGSKK